MLFKFIFILYNMALQIIHISVIMQLSCIHSIFIWEMDLSPVPSIKTSELQGQNQP